MDNMQKGFLIAGGLLILGFLGYTLFGKKEEEIEDAEYIIVVDTNSGQTVTQEKNKESESVASKTPKKAEISIVKNENIPFDQVAKDTILKDETKPTSFLRKVEEEPTQQTLVLADRNTALEIDIPQQENIEKLEVLAPEELIVEANDEFPLKLGSKGQRVWDLKVYLMKNHGGAGIITNDFDKQTAERVNRFLKVDEVSKQLYNKLSIGQPRKKKRNVTKKKH